MASNVALVDEYIATGLEPTPCPPTGKGTYDELARWVHDGIFQTSPLRLRDVLEWRENELLDQGYQWLRTVAGQFGGLSNWIDMFWDASVDKRMPMPVLNKGLDRRMIESAALGRPNFTPVVRPRGSNPDLKQKVSARKLQSRLRQRLTEQNWEAENELVAYHPALYGNVWTFSEWEESYDDVIGRPIQGAMQCSAPGCGTVVASMTRPTSDPFSKEGIPLQGCPTCPPDPMTGQAQPMIPYTPTPDEAMKRRDAFGRPLGMPVPRGRWTCKVVPPDYVFLRNMGLDCRPGELDDFTYVHIETMDWLRQHYPVESKDVKPDDPAILAAWHAIGGAPYTLSMTLGMGLFKDMIRVKERHRGRRLVPSPDGQGLVQDNGRSVVVAGRKVMRNADYYIPSKTKPGMQVPRARLDWAQWELRDGGRRAQGLSLWRVMRDSQKISNEILGQTQAVRRTAALPIWLASRENNFELSALKEGLPGYIAEVEIDPANPTFEPKLVNNVTIASGVFTELGQQDGFMNSIVPSIEGGSSTGGVDAAKAMKELKQAAGNKREPRIRRIKDMLTRQFKHGADLEQNLDVSPHECKYVNEDGDESYQMFVATDYDCDIEIDVEPSEEDADAQREATELLAGDMRVISGADSPEMKRKIVAIVGGDALCEKLFESEMLQDNAAKREWVYFRDANAIPIVDPTMDNSQVHLTQHARDWESEVCREKRRACAWEQALSILNVNFEQNLQFLASIPPLVPGQPPDPKLPQNLPNGLQARIVFWWGQLLQQGGYVSPDPQALAFVLNWRAHMETHRITEEMKQQAAAMAAKMAAPAGPATPAGTQVHDGAAPSGKQGGPGAGADGYQRQVDQQKEVRQISKSVKEKS